MHNIEREIAKLQTMTVSELQQKYAEVFGETTRVHNRAYLWKRIAWRLQMQAEGDISERACQRAAELAREEDIRLHPPKEGLPAPSPAGKRRSRRDKRLPTVGACISRMYQGRLIEVEVLRDGFRHEGRRYKTLSSVAKAVTGTHWNGFAFFGLTGKTGGRK